ARPAFLHGDGLTAAADFAVAEVLAMPPAVTLVLGADAHANTGALEIDALGRELGQRTRRRRNGEQGRSRCRDADSITHEPSPVVPLVVPNAGTAPLFPFERSDGVNALLTGSASSSPAQTAESGMRVPCSRP